MARRASSSLTTRPGPARPCRIGKVICPGAGVRIASQIEPVVAALRWRCPAGKRPGHVVEALRFHGAHTQAGRLGVQRQRDARRQAAAAAADQHVGRGHPRSRRPVRRSPARRCPDRRSPADRRRAGSASARGRPTAAAPSASRSFGGAVVQHHLGAIGPCVGDLYRRRIGGHQDHRRHAMRRRRPGHALRVVAR